MDPADAQPSISFSAGNAKQRCLSLQTLILNSLPPHKLSSSAKLTLLRLLHAELRFLSSLPSPSTSTTSSNISHFESIAGVLLHPALLHASRLCKPLPFSTTATHIDIACIFRRSPAWFLVSSRISFSRAERALLAARSAPAALKPSSVFLVFSRGLPDDTASAIRRHLDAVEVDPHAEGVGFEDLEYGWVGVGWWWGMEGSRWFELKIEGDDRNCGEKGGALTSVGDGEEVDCGDDEFGGLVSSLRLGGMDVVNFDTTALIAVVSGISNGDGERLRRSQEGEMRQRFKGNYEFVMAQVTSELEQPILIELKAVLEGKKGIICESVCSEFNELICMCGGSKEKLRAEQLLKHLVIVPDSPSPRISDLPTTRKMAAKNKIIFGTGDHWHAPTLTANMGFVRAVSQFGMSLLTIEHRPRALVGD